MKAGLFALVFLSATVMGFYSCSKNRPAVAAVSEQAEGPPPSPAPALPPEPSITSAPIPPPTPVLIAAPSPTLIRKVEAGAKARVVADALFMHPNGTSKIPAGTILMVDAITGKEAKVPERIFERRSKSSARADPGTVRA